MDLSLVFQLTTHQASIRHYPGWYYLRPSIGAQTKGSPKHKDYIRTFDNSDDYVYDVDWNPSNPGLFSCVNNEGYIDLWDLTSDVEALIPHYKVNKSAINKNK